MLKQFLVDKMPFLGKYKRYGVALMHAMGRERQSYSQHGEDAVIWEILKNYELDGSIYVDVGANHPSDISNTYLLYRKGLSGIVIEPNPELLGLYRRFRRRDIPLQLGCSNESAVLRFSISKAPVLSSFKDRPEIGVYKNVYTPVLRLDDVLSAFDFKFIHLLCIDVEGLGYEALQGAAATTRRSLLLCLEYDDAEEKDRFQELLGDRFEVIEQIGCNLILLNDELDGSLKQCKWV